MMSQSLLGIQFMWSIWNEEIMKAPVWITLGCMMPAVRDDARSVPAMETCNSRRGFSLCPEDILPLYTEAPFLALVANIMAGKQAN